MSRTGLKTQITISSYRIITIFLTKSDGPKDYRGIGTQNNTLIFYIKVCCSLTASKRTICVCKDFEKWKEWIA